MSRLLLAACAAALALGCAPRDGGEGPPGTDETAGSKAAAELAAQPPVVKPDVDPDAPKKKTIRPPVAAEQAPAASPRLEKLPPVDELTQKIATHFEGEVNRRIYVQVDKPLYKPGETIWIKAWDLKLRDLSGPEQFSDVHYELVSPKGSTVISKRVAQQKGLSTNDFVLPDGVQGGEYEVRATARDGEKGIRKIIVSTYEPPRVKKKLEFVRKAYGAGDEVTATIEVKRPTGEPLGGQALRGLVTLDGQQLPPISLTTNADGGGLVRFQLPAEIERGDALLTVLVDDGGVTESITRRVPIILKKLEFSVFPEGGALVTGLPSRVYFEAKNLIGKPADVAGRVVDDQGNAVARFESYKNGLGRFEFTPATGRTYKVEITRPVGVTEQYTVPVAEDDGCVLRTFDDLDGQADALRLAVRCASPRTVIVTGMLRDRLLDAAAVAVPDSGPAIVHLKPQDEGLGKARGVARVTVFDETLEPMAERVVMRNRRAGLQVKVEPSAERYVPRAQAALEITTTAPDGTPVPAELALSVVDDTVISFADDKKGHLLAKVLLEGEVPGKIEEPKFYFDLKEEKSALAMELLMGTRGWRKFEWQRVKNPPPKVSATTGSVFGGAIGQAEGFGGLGLRGVGRGGGGRGQGLGLGNIGARGKGAGPGARPRRPRGAAPVPARPMAVAAAEQARPAADPAPPAEPAPPPPPPAAQPARAAEAPRMEEAEAEPMPMARQARRRAMKPMLDARMDDDIAADVAAKGEIAQLFAEADKDWAGAEKKKMAANVGGWWSAPVTKARVFPAPDYPLEYDGPRTDFRETIHWAPAVRTGPDGKATVTFHLSDAVTSFRVFAEGAGGAMIGRSEEVITSSLPFSMAAKLPVEVSQGDVLELPLILSNEQKNPLPLSLASDFGEGLKLQKPVTLPEPTLAPEARQSLYYPLEVTAVRGQSDVKLAANAGGLKDEFVRQVRIEPLGFPQLAESGGTLSKDGVSMNFDFSAATAGTFEGTLKLYPSPISTMTGGLAGLIRQPSGCFEQTSSSNYPNVMVLRYLQANDVADPALVARTNGLIEKGYNRLVGYETKKDGYEWFGSSPPHEALTAYGILQFLDMKRVYGGVDDAMIQRTVAYLKGRRDGKGGFQRNQKALDSFGRASKEVTDAYITWAVAEAGLGADFGPEIDAQTRRGTTTKDAYLLALAANTLLAMPARADAGRDMARRLAEMQGSEGAWTGADHSITKSSGKNLHIETTALAMMALMSAGGHEDAVRKAVDWLNKNRGGFGQWGATQATVLALEAMTAYTEKNRATKGAGTVSLVVDGKVVASKAYAAGHRDPIEFDDIGRHLSPAKHTIELRLDGADRLPFSMAIEYRAQNPESHPEATVAVATTLSRDSVPMGEAVRLMATVKNVTDQGQPMTLARIGFPGGLTFQTWQLKELREKKIIAF